MLSCGTFCCLAEGDFEKPPLGGHLNRVLSGGTSIQRGLWLKPSLEYVTNESNWVHCYHVVFYHVVNGCFRQLMTNATSIALKSKSLVGQCSCTFVCLGLVISAIRIQSKTEVEMSDYKYVISKYYCSV